MANIQFCAGKPTEKSAVMPEDLCFLKKNVSVQECGIPRGFTKQYAEFCRKLRNEVLIREAVKNAKNQGENVLVVFSSEQSLRNSAVFSSAERVQGEKAHDKIGAQTKNGGIKNEHKFSIQFKSL